MHFWEGVHLDQGLIGAAEQNLQVIFHMQQNTTALGQCVHGAASALVWLRAVLLPLRTALSAALRRVVCAQRA